MLSVMWLSFVQDQIKVNQTLCRISDAAWGGSLDDRKSPSGYIFQVGGSAISWRSQKKTFVALLAAKSEVIALTSATQDSLWLFKHMF